MFINRELRRHGKLVIGQDPAVKLHIFKWLHDSAVRGHSGRDATLSVLDHVGSAAYKLQLPPSAAIHNVFHVSQLKRCVNPATASSALPQYFLDLGTSKEPEAILDRKMVQRHGAAATKVLVH
ncbi:hypothetical protein V2J09_018286 [Rumex salicifolius]